MKRRFLLASSLGAMVLALAGHAHAQPTEPVEARMSGLTSRPC
jgi:hypothetical protein